MLFNRNAQFPAPCGALGGTINVALYELQLEHVPLVIPAKVTAYSADAAPPDPVHGEQLIVHEPQLLSVRETAILSNVSEDAVVPLPTPKY